MFFVRVRPWLTGLLFCFADRARGQDARGRVRYGYQHQVEGQQAVRALGHHLYAAEAEVSLLVAYIVSCRVVSVRVVLESRAEDTARYSALQYG